MMGEFCTFALLPKMHIIGETVRDQKERSFGAIIAASVVVLSMLSAFFMWMTLRERSFSISNDVQGANGIIAFRYIDLQNATKKFSGRIGSGGFGSVFKGLLTDSTTIAVKRLDGVRQGEKQFRAEVSSIGIIQHINLIKPLASVVKGIGGCLCMSTCRIAPLKHIFLVAIQRS